MPYPTNFDPEAMELMAQSLAAEQEALRAAALRNAIESKLNLIKHIIVMRIRCCAPCHKWRLGR